MQEALHVARDAGWRRIDAGVMTMLRALAYCQTHDIAGKYLRPKPGARSLELCGSWQSLQVTPAVNILPCLNGV
jgi:hypothetical protein